MKFRSLFFITVLVVFVFVGIQAQDFSSLVSKAEFARQRGEYPNAFENLKSALDLAEASGDRSKQAQIYNLFGHIYYLKAEYNSAIQSFRKAEKLANSVNDKREEARSWAFLGQLYWRVVKFEDAERLLKDALEVFEKSNDEINLAMTLRFLGRSKDGKGIVEKSAVAGIFLSSKIALDLYERSLAISRKIGDEEGEFATLKEIGLMYQGQKEMPQYLEKALSFFEPLRLRLRESNYRRLYAVVLNNIATNKYLVGHDAGNDELSRKAMEESIATAEQAASIFREIGDLQEFREMLDREAFCLYFIERYAKALPIVEESIKVAEDLYHQPIGGTLDRSQYFVTLIGSYRLKREILSKLKRPVEMFETLEAAKSLALRELMNRGKKVQMPLDAIEKTEVDRLNLIIDGINRQISLIKRDDSATKPLLATLNLQLQKTRLELDENQANLSSKYGNSENIVRSKPLNITQLCDAIPDQNTAIIDYYASEKFVWETFILTKSQSGIVPTARKKGVLSETIPMSDGSVCSLNVALTKSGLEDDAFTKWANEYARRVPEFHEQLARNSPAFVENSKFIYDAVIADIIPFIKTKKHLVIIPGGTLSGVPFQALINESGRYLIEDFSISYAPSLSVLAKMQENRLNLKDHNYKGDFLGFGNPKLSLETVAKMRTRYRSGKLENLPEAEGEVQTIAKFYASNKILIGKNASEDAWREESQNYRILHLATHGLSDSEKPMYSHVLLSPDADNDGLIEAREIAEMNLPAEMVVLSACETARGRDIEGEGMVGLAWSFAAAGVPTVIASNWKVDSQSTSDFLIDFYTQLNGKTKINKAEAMQKAAIRQLRNRKTRNPFYWSSFAIYGDWFE